MPGHGTHRCEASLWQLPSSIMLSCVGYRAKVDGVTSLADIGEANVTAERRVCSVRRCSGMVFVLDSNRKPLDPCHPARARKLLKAGKAAVFRRYPFTIILKERRVADSTTHAHRVKIDPGSKVTGIAVVNEVTGRVVWAAELTHRGQQIRERLLARRQLRRARRSRKTRYRKARFNNRRRPSGWLPPSLASRVANIETWVKRLLRLCPVEAISMELVASIRRRSRILRSAASNTSGANFTAMRSGSICWRSSGAGALTAGRRMCPSKSSTSCPGAGVELTG